MSSTLSSFSRSTSLVPLVCALLLLPACNTVERLQRVGTEPPLARVENPTEREQYQPISWPAPKAQPVPPKGANSLWQPGAKAFFRDQRARQEGDILTVMIEINDQAQMDNNTQSDRSASESMQIPAVAGLENKIYGILPGQDNPANMFDITNESQAQGQGRINRRDRIRTNIAALVTQVLPNGNLVISGKQEVRVNYELREIGVEGVVRPEDISANNSIDLSKVAEARITYGGRGTLSDRQQPRYGHQLIDILSPF